ncbi:hypothetical protein H8356DRAFT_928157 [Neocallimastix lanati (nom. inval.)]|uniref:Uncharacterized protein n=1 Tax=Neocallimastix californiae TaxID=1754190 RepID=A0A1Y2AEH9_9FUNG|nr:hypothetical protein H8356DRAFT_928157 [Neocallimastix sp. JGI-2020a]ORY20896.1 hypothetical protein LY90DRAFT_516444 [Neocallimastix californiae]|eukprot:ORY20896.1 hypothetical protein LY90DRAFT_516444 [Neocallimastix californiae]
MNESNKNSGFLQDIYIETNQFQVNDIEQNNVKNKNNNHPINNKNGNGTKSIHEGKSNSKNKFTSNKKKIGPRQPYFISNRNSPRKSKSNNNNNNCNNNMNNKKRAIKDIQQFCRDIKNSKKFNAIYNSQSSFSYYNPTIEPILLNESDESLNCYSGFYNKNNNLNFMDNMLLERRKNHLLTLQTSGKILNILINHL